MVSEPLGECAANKVQASLELIQHMQNDGFDLSRPRPVTHLFLGAEDAVERASKLFAEHGFDVLEAGNGQLLLGDKVSLSDEWVSQTIPAMCLKADDLGIVYDGWDVDVADEDPARQN